MLLLFFAGSGAPPVTITRKASEMPMMGVGSC